MHASMHMRASQCDHPLPGDVAPIPALLLQGTQFQRSSEGGRRRGASGCPGDYPVNHVRVTCCVQFFFYGGLEIPRRESVGSLGENRRDPNGGGGSRRRKGSWCVVCDRQHAIIQTSQNKIEEEKKGGWGGGGGGGGGRRKHTQNGYSGYEIKILGHST